MRQKGNKLREPSPLIDTLNSSLIFEELSISFHKQRQIWHQLLEDGENLLSLPGNRYNSPAALKKALHLLNKDVTCSLVEVTIFSSELRVHNNSYCDRHSKMDDTLDSSQRQPLQVSSPSQKRTRRNGTAVKFTLVTMVFQLVLIAVFSVLVDYGGHSLPPKPVSEQTKATGSNKTVAGQKRQEPPSPNDISVYYPSKIL